MLKIPTKHSDQSFFIGLNTISNAADAVANDVLYHLKCWPKTQRDAERMEKGGIWDTFAPRALNSDKSPLQNAPRGVELSRIDLKFKFLK